MFPLKSWVCQVLGPLTPSSRAHLGAQPESGALAFLSVGPGNCTLLSSGSGRLRSGAFHDLVGDGRGHQKHWSLLPPPRSFFPVSPQKMLKGRV